MQKLFTLLLSLGLAVGGLTACEGEGDVEDAAEDTGDAVGDAAEDAGDAAEDVAE